MRQSNAKKYPGQQVSVKVEQIEINRVCCFSERTVEYKVNAVRIYVYIAAETVLTTLKKTEKWYG